MINGDRGMSWATQIKKVWNLINLWSQNYLFYFLVAVLDCTTLQINMISFHFSGFMLKKRCNIFVYSKRIICFNSVWIFNQTETQSPLEKSWKTRTIFFHLMWTGVDIKDWYLNVKHLPSIFRYYNLAMFIHVYFVNNPNIPFFLINLYIWCMFFNGYTQKLLTCYNSSLPSN